MGCFGFGQRQYMPYPPPAPAQASTPNPYFMYPQQNFNRPAEKPKAPIPPNIAAINKCVKARETRHKKWAQARNLRPQDPPKQQSQPQPILVQQIVGADGKMYFQTVAPQAPHRYMSGGPMVVPMPSRRRGRSVWA